jgi:hypothetical protein
MAKTKPIRPTDVTTKKTEALPDAVIEAFNQLIVANWDGTKAKVRAKEAAELIASKLDISPALVYERKYLDVEDVFRKAGWKVKYDQPYWDESYEPYFTFTKNTR